MAGIALPPAASVTRYVATPHQPQDPPTNHDVVEAHNYVHKVQQVHRVHADVQDVDYAGAIRYEAAVVANTGAGQPLWFAAALAPLQEQLNAIDVKINTIEAKVNTIEAKVNTIEAKVNTIETKVNTIQADLTQTISRQTDFIRTMAKKSNWENGTERDTTLEIVPFPDGTYPSEAQPPLPPLNTIGAVRDLNHRERNAYLDKYFPDQHIGGSPAEKTKQLLQALGCEDSP